MTDATTEHRAQPGWHRTTRGRRVVLDEVDRLLGDGHTITAVAAALHIAETTVSARRRANLGLMPPDPVGAALSAQQARVLARMADQDEPSTADAARDLGMSRSALENTLYRAYRRLGVHTLLGAYRVHVVEQDRRLVNWRRPV